MVIKRIALMMIVLTVALSGCKKDKKALPLPVDEKSKLPAVTATGAGTFGALVRGKAFIAKNVECAYSRFKNFPDSYVLLISATAADNTKIRFSLQIIPKLAAKTSFTINNILSVYNWLGQYTEGPTTANVFNTKVDVNGTLTVETLDEENKIMSGSFAFDAVNSDGTKISITDGRYDTHFVYSEQ